MPVNERYEAFLSYSHADQAVARSLHRALESFRIPKKLVGMETAAGVVPQRLRRIFKDREELAAAGSLNVEIERALAASDALIVICSRAAAQSRWVSEEVRVFKKLHGESRVFAVIVDGTPSASRLPGREAEECLPPALRFAVDADGTITDIAAEPVAADYRRQGDGRRLATLKLVAGLTGLKLDDLVRREAQRRQARVTTVAVISGVLAVSMAALAVVAVRARAEAEHQRAEADGLVEFMLTDLRAKLEPVGRLDALDVVGQRALKYYAGQNPGTLDADELGRRSRALHLVGEVRNTRGDSESALAAFKEAAATTGELLARDPGNGKRIFDHAQSVFWAGYVAFQRGQNKEAEAAFREYKRLAGQLIAIDKKNDDWQMEESYAESNLGTLFLKEGRYTEAEQAYAGALRVVEAVAARKPADLARQVDVGRALSWLSLARERLNQSETALQLLQREVAIYEGVLRIDPAHTSARSGAAVAWSSIGRLALEQGRHAEAIAAYQTAIATSERLVALEPKNSNWRDYETRMRIGFAEALYMLQKRKDSRVEYESAARLLDTLVKRDAKNVVWNVEWRSRLELLDAILTAAGNDFDAALTKVDAARVRLREHPNAKGNKEMLFTLALAELVAGDIQFKLGRNAEAHQSWQSATSVITGEDESVRSTLLMLRLLASRRLGDSGRAARIAPLLDQRQFRHPLYLGSLLPADSGRPLW